MLQKRQSRRRPRFQTSIPHEQPKCRVRSLLWTIIRRTCFVLGALMLTGIVLGLLSALTRTQPALPGQMVLYVPLKDGFVDQPDPPSLTDPFAAQEQQALQEQIDAIDRAAKDDRVKGLVAVMDDGNFALAHVQEIRPALKRFKATGKFMTIYSNSFGDPGKGIGRFFLASLFKKRWMQPLGTVTLSGVRMEMPFFHETLKKIGIEPQFFHRKAYKTVFENVTQDNMSPQNREMLTKLLADIKGNVLPEMATDLKMTPARLDALIDKGLFTDAEALQAGLITDVNYEDVLYDTIAKNVTGKTDGEDRLFVNIMDYAGETQRSDHHQGLFHALEPAHPAVALIYASGAIVQSADHGGPPGLGDKLIAADDLGPTIMDVADDDAVKAIVLRIDSPGGSPGASETILRSLAKAKEKGKKIIVSMGPTAASGGYWIASNADRIFALPATLTGSIGVAGGKVSAADFWKKWGVNWDSVSWGENSGIWSINRPFSAAEAERINATMDQVYAAFIARVAEGRHLKPEQVEAVAQGRVWTGETAAKIGLVDEIGGLGDALNYAGRILGAKDQSGIEIEILPKPKTAFEELLDFISGDQSARLPIKLSASIREFFQPLVQAFAVLSGDDVIIYDPLKIK